MGAPIGISGGGGPLPEYTRLYVRATRCPLLSGRISCSQSAGQWGEVSLRIGAGRCVQEVLAHKLPASALPISAGSAAHPHRRRRSRSPCCSWRSCPLAAGAHCATPAAHRPAVHGGRSSSRNATPLAHSRRQRECGRRSGIEADCSWPPMQQQQQQQRRTSYTDGSMMVRVPNMPSAFSLLRWGCKDGRGGQSRVCAATGATPNKSQVGACYGLDRKSRLSSRTLP